ncbi:olfactory receptor 146-like [Cyprinodon tularosa]|uniref:olfactory receptor 146-like n=1 Tax=Cyprinodon variegatus TaxID=28743 RepID=UPI0007424F23|nr:PREDICTED: olfactory receptor 146-like [Cyprinodon variegatus]XP_038129632.1 olfactory receptor 146-like [Cyprinodon tularosa]
MELLSANFGKNITFVRPAYFIISGFIGLPNMKYYYVLLFFAFIISIFGNTAVMSLIYLDPNLKTPKFVAVFNLAFVDLLGSTALVPKVIDIFLFNNYSITYRDCLTFFFFCYSFLSMQSLNLVALSYDRLMAIMFPLRYHVKVTHKNMLSLILFFWLFVFISNLVAVGFLTRLSFCKSVVINSYFCDYGQIFRLACNNYFPNFVIGHMIPCFVLWLPLGIILFSYISIGHALAKVATFEERVKAFKTCTAHLSLVAIYYFPILITFAMYGRMHQNARIVNLSIPAVVPPMLNPIIYVLQTQEIKLSIKKLIKIKRKPKVTVK